MSRAALLIAVAACATPPVATQLDADRAHVALADLQEGRAQLVRKCSGCHRAPLPSERERAAWPKQLDDMAERAHLEPDERRVIEAYLIAMAPR